MLQAYISVTPNESVAVKLMEESLCMLQILHGFCDVLLFSGIPSSQVKRIRYLLVVHFSIFLILN